MGRLLSAIPLLLALGALAPRAAVAQEGLVFRWEAPPPCPTPEEVRGEILRLLGHGAAQAPDLPVIDARVAPLPAGGFSLEMSLSGGGRILGSRHLSGDSCDSVAEAAALVAALAIDPGAVAREAERTAAPPAAEDARRVGPPPNRGASSRASALSEPPRRRRPEPDGGGEADGLVADPSAGSSVPSRDAGAAPATADLRIAPLLEIDLGTLPAPAVGPGLSLAWRRGPIVLELRGLYLPSQRERIDAHASAAGRLTLVAGGAGVCVPLARGRVELSPCAGFEVGSMAGEGEGVSDPGAGAGLWAALRAGMAAAVELLPWLHLRTELGGAVALRRPVFVLDGVGQVHRPTPVVGRATLGLEVRFP